MAIVNTQFAISNDGVSPNRVGQVADRSADRSMLSDRMDAGATGIDQWTLACGDKMD